MTTTCAMRSRTTEALLEVRSLMSARLAWALEQDRGELAQGDVEHKRCPALAGVVLWAMTLDVAEDELAARGVIERKEPLVT